MLKRDLPLIAAYNRIFAPLHERLFTQAMTGWQTLSADRMLQRSTYSDGTSISVNFDRSARKLGNATLPARSAIVLSAGQPAQTIEMRKIFDSKLKQ